MIRQTAALTALLSTLLFSGHACATVVDFEDRGHIFLAGAYQSFSEQGLNFVGGNMWILGANTRCAGISNNSNRVQFNRHFSYTISATNSARFSLKKLDLGLNCTLEHGEEEVLFSATLADGSIVNQSVTASMDEFRTFSFAGFDNIKSIEISKNSSSGSISMNLDNILFEALADQPIPEPGTLALALLGLAGLAGSRRRGKRHSAS